VGAGVELAFTFERRVQLTVHAFQRHASRLACVPLLTRVPRCTHVASGCTAAQPNPNRIDIASDTCWRFAASPRGSFPRGAVQRRGRGRGEGRQEAPSGVSGTRARATYCSRLRSLLLKA
jgi:hypothetical protein